MQAPEKIPLNFLISYVGRVGSTALIDTLKTIPGFLVPVFEELDFWWIEKNGRLDEYNNANIHNAVAGIYNSERADIDLSCTSVGFKWRIWGDLNELARVLSANKVVLFNMMRSDALELISSLYVTDVINKEFNAPQFMLRDAATEEERQQILWKYQIELYEVNISAFFEVFRMQINSEKERLKTLYQLNDAGVPVHTILYEDFAYKKFAFLDAFVKLLGHPRLITFPTTKLTKVSRAYPSESFRNRAELVNSTQLVPALREWDEIVYERRFHLMKLNW